MILWIKKHQDYTGLSAMEAFDQLITDRNKNEELVIEQCSYSLIRLWIKKKNLNKCLNITSDYQSWSINVVHWFP